MFSARFDGGEVEAAFRRVHAILQERGYNVLMVKAGAGDDFGKDTKRFLAKLLTSQGVLLAVCSAKYAEMTGSMYSSFCELQFAYDNKVQVCGWKRGPPN